MKNNAHSTRNKLQEMEKDFNSKLGNSTIYYFTRCVNLNPTQKDIICLILNFTQNDKRCYYTHEAIGRIIGKDKGTISNNISKLQAINIIKKGKQVHNKNKRGSFNKGGLMIDIDELYKLHLKFIEDNPIYFNASIEEEEYIEEEEDMTPEVTAPVTQSTPIEEEVEVTAPTTLTTPKEEAIPTPQPKATTPDIPMDDELTTEEISDFFNGDVYAFNPKTSVEKKFISPKEAYDVLSGSIKKLTKRGLLKVLSGELPKDTYRCIFSYESQLKPVTK